MAFTFESGTNAATLFAALNSRALDMSDTNAQTIAGQVIVPSVKTDEIYDSDNALAIELDEDNSKMKIYNGDIGYKTCAGVITTFNENVSTPLSTTIKTIAIPSGKINGMCIVKYAISAVVYNTLIYFTNNKNHTKFITSTKGNSSDTTLAGSYLLNDKIAMPVGYNTQLNYVYIDGSNIKFEFYTSGGSGSTIDVTIDWEVW